MENSSEADLNDDYDIIAKLAGFQSSTFILSTETDWKKFLKDDSGILSNPQLFIERMKNTKSDSKSTKLPLYAKGSDNLLVADSLDDPPYNSAKHILEVSQ